MADAHDLPKDFYLWNEPGFSDPTDKNRPNRLCVCFSDVHFTDGTVGNQSADQVAWERVFKNIADVSAKYDIKELTIVLVGDVADMIRSSEWARNKVYPWQREHNLFKLVLRGIMGAIIDRHAKPMHHDSMCAFFHLLDQFQSDHKNYKVRTLVLLGNHDKEIFADDESLKMFYEQCLFRPVDNASENRLSDDYRRWIGKMYFNDEQKYLDPERESVPWLPFYWGDPGFRLFLTHGQWRDITNSRKIQGVTEDTSWQVSDGWQLKRWQNMNFSPFTEACFGDTVAAGLLSGFIYRAKTELDELLKQSDEEIQKLKRVLDELDLYRPTSAAVKRVIQQIWRIKKKNSHLSGLREKIENILLDSVHDWINWDFTRDSAPPLIYWFIVIFRPFANIFNRVRHWVGLKPLNLWTIYGLMSLLAWVQQWHRNDPSYKDMKNFPGFLDAYRNYGFRIHGEGHTHIPLQEELYFDSPTDDQNYTYINFGAWRDQIVPKQEKSCRRRGVGRALYVVDLAQGSRYSEREAERCFMYWVEDVLSWGDKADRWDIA